MAQLFRIVLLISIIGSAFPARINIEDMDYNSLVDLIADYENEKEEAQKGTVIVVEEELVPEKTDIKEPFLTSILAPNVEVLRLVEAFIKLKGDLAERAHLLVSDNWDLIKGVYKLVLNKITKLHGFTLMTVSVIRKILEFAVDLVQGWETTKHALFH